MVPEVYSQGIPGNPATAVYWRSAGTLTPRPPQNTLVRSYDPNTRQFGPPARANGTPDIGWNPNFEAVGANGMPASPGGTLSNYSLTISSADPGAPNLQGIISVGQASSGPRILPGADFVILPSAVRASHFPSGQGQSYTYRITISFTHSVQGTSRTATTSQPAILVLQNSSVVPAPSTPPSNQPPNSGPTPVPQTGGTRPPPKRLNHRTNRWVPIVFLKSPPRLSFDSIDPIETRNLRLSMRMLGARSTSMPSPPGSR